jgi:hypothetical protein
MTRHLPRIPAGFRLTALAILIGAQGLGAQAIVGPARNGEPARARVRTPEEHFGFRMGADQKLAHWDDMVKYYDLLASASDRMKVVNMGKTSEGRPFYALFISSPGNLANLEALRRINATIADPRGVPDDSLEGLVGRGKAVVLQSMSMHSTEVGGSQMAVELVYDLLSRNDDEARRILDNVIAIVIPSFNPDGQVMVTEWYRKTLGTDAENTSPPWLYQKYAGHDNNRDAFQQNLPDSKYMAKLLFREWIPQAYVDHHHMGGNGARIYLPPYAEPVRPSADPLVWRELAWYGGHMATKEEEYGMSGVINDAVYSGWGHMGFHWITPFHNIAGMLTESASAALASPVTLTPQQLQGNTRNLMTYKEQTNFPNPWPGGTWHLRDIVDRQKISAWATLDLAARNKEMVLRNMYLKGKRQTERGANGTPKAFIVSLGDDQHDPLTARKMIQNLLNQGVEVLQASASFSHDNRSYGAGTYVVSMAQPKMGVVRWMLGRTFYPDNEYTRDNDGNPIRPYDMATDVMAEFMGVRVEPTDAPVSAGLARVHSAEPPAGKVASGATLSFSGKLNDSWRAANMLMAKGAAIRRVDKAAGALHVGDYLVRGAKADLLGTVAKATGVDFVTTTGNTNSISHALRPLRVAMYQRYNGGNMDEGWTRLLFEDFGQPFKSIFDPELKSGSLITKYDVIVLPADNPGTLVGRVGGPGAGRGAVPAGAAPPPARGGGAPVSTAAGDPNPRGGGGNAVLGGPGGGAGGGRGGGGGGGAGRGGQMPPEFRSGFGDEGISALREFVTAGGTLVTFGESGQFAIERFELPLRDVTAGLPYKQFWCPGCTLRIQVDTANALGYGMPANALAVWLANSQAYDILPNAPAGTTVIARFADRDVLQSGWLLGENVIAGKPTVVSVPFGQGRVVLYGFRVQHRHQAHGTYKLLFNVLQGAARID